MNGRKTLAAAVAAVVVAVALACQPPRAKPGDEIKINEKASFVVPAGWAGTHQSFMNGRSYDFRIGRERPGVGVASLIFRAPDAGNVPAAVEKPPENALARTAPRASSVRLGAAAFDVTTTCYLAPAWENTVTHERVEPPWYFHAAATTSHGGTVIALRARYDLPTVGREATTVPEEVTAPLEAAFLRTVTTAFRFK